MGGARIFVTGGTIDGIEKSTGEKGEGKSSVPGLLEKMKLGAGYSVEVLMLKDNRDMSEEDRELISEKCAGCAEKKIIITHGTWTMPQTAKYLGRKGLGKTIVLVGARIPAGREGSDAEGNLRFALDSARELPNGAYIAMGGRIFSYDNVRKNPETGRFEEEK